MLLLHTFALKTSLKRKKTVLVRKKIAAFSLWIHFFFLLSFYFELVATSNRSIETKILHSSLVATIFIKCRLQSSKCATIMQKIHVCFPPPPKQNHWKITFYSVVKTYWQMLELWTQIVSLFLFCLTFCFNLLRLNYACRHFFLLLAM